MKLNFNVQEELSILFNDKTNQNYLLQLFLISLVYGVAIIISVIVLSFSFMLFFIPFLTLFSICCFGILFFITMVFYLFYLTGYTVNLVKNYQKGEKIIPNPMDFKAHLKIGLIPSITSTLIYFVAPTFLMLIPLVFSIFTGAIGDKSETLSDALVLPNVLVWIVFLGITFIFYILVSLYIYPVMMYKYAETNSIQKALSGSTLRSYIKNYWKEMTVIGLATYGVTMVLQMFLSNIPVIGVALASFGAIVLMILQFKAYTVAFEKK